VKATGTVIQQAKLLGEESARQAEIMGKGFRRDRAHPLACVFAIGMAPPIP